MLCAFSVRVPSCCSIVRPSAGAVVASRSTVEFLYRHGITLDLGTFVAAHADYCWRMRYAEWLDAMHDLTSK